MFAIMVHSSANVHFRTAFSQSIVGALFKPAMAHAKQKKDWEQRQRHGVAHRDPEVPPGPRDQQVWVDAREALQAETANCMQPLWGSPLHTMGASSSAAEPGAGIVDTPLRELQEVCRQHAWEVLSTTETVLDPLQFTRMVCGRPVQACVISAIALQFRGWYICVKWVQNNFMMSGHCFGSR